ncbi:hypothetical protein ACFLWW_02570 [Chloroflexota bacterium]
MKVKLINNKLLVTVCLLLLISILLITVGCQEETIQTQSTPVLNDLSTTLVPNMDLDMYVYVRQDNPTTVPKSLVGTSLDILADSLALWGIPTGDTFILGGGLTFVSKADAAKIYAQVSDQAKIWTKLSERTIYFVQGSGTVAETMKAAISSNNFKKYDDQNALLEVALLPDSGTTKLAAIGIVIPSENLTELIAKNINPNYSGMVDTLLTQAKLQVITVGLYAPQQIDVIEITQKIERGSIWESDLGVLALIKSGLPGFVVSPIVKNVLDNAGYVETTVGELTLHKGSLDVGDGKDIPVLIMVDGNRIYVTASGQESYAQTTITNAAK